MLKDNIQPSSLDGIKRYAKQLKKANGIPHNKALDIAAKAGSFANYTHARKQFQNVTSNDAQGEELFLTAYWYDNKVRKIGRETLKVTLASPVLEIASKSELRKARGLDWFRVVAPDHLVKDEQSHSQSEARRMICSAVRTLRFMEATGLKPSKDFEAAYPNRDRNNRLPKTDHSTDWFDPSTGQFILIDEPYAPAVIDAGREDWAKKHNWHILKSKWAGMYYPHECELFVVADASSDYDFQGLMSKIDAIDEPITEETWNGTSADDHEVFLSPLAKSPQDKRRAQAKGTIYRVSTKKTIPMRLQSSYNDRRPNAAMPIPKHLEAARIIKAIQQAPERPWSVYGRMNKLKSILEDWFFAEHSREETDKYDLFYYGDVDADDPFVIEARTSEGVIELLHKLKSILLKYYVDCEPRNSLIKKIDFSIKATRKA
ncbi:DUF5623 domain-containing protein [Kordiimonas sp. SCSIO 12603]|uniref:DUF5623 domain-containing protein n=1 Tax=Kordiimonas sp. SCSIO 12603 TaxID=2829596 RepID=UPI0021035AC0|nr:DUF5623 domain-containing protein [Kordiimonas sp. SCSIO 12603]UTW60236.1 DUF5623 domain-containing protein [Kordiimonas sp. SCSIO 12603]